MAQFGTVSYSGAIFAQLHSLLDAARAEQGGAPNAGIPPGGAATSPHPFFARPGTPPAPATLPPIRHLEESASAPVLYSMSARRSRPTSASASPRGGLGGREVFGRRE